MHLFSIVMRYLIDETVKLILIVFCLLLFRADNM